MSPSNSFPSTRRKQGNACFALLVLVRMMHVPRVTQNEQRRMRKNSAHYHIYSCFCSSVFHTSCGTNPSPAEPQGTILSSCWSYCACSFLHLCQWAAAPQLMLIFLGLGSSWICPFLRLSKWSVSVGVTHKVFSLSTDKKIGTSPIKYFPYRDGTITTCRLDRLMIPVWKRSSKKDGEGARARQRQLLAQWV